MRKRNTRNKMFKILAIFFIAILCIKILPQTAIKVFIRTNPLKNIGTSSSLYNNYWRKAESQEKKQNIENTYYYYYRNNGRDIRPDMKKYILGDANNIDYTHLGSRVVYVISSGASFRNSYVDSSGYVRSGHDILFYSYSSYSGEDISNGGRGTFLAALRPVAVLQSSNRYRQVGTNREWNIE